MGVEPEDGELGAIGQAELVQYRADAIADRAFAQEQSGGDVAVIEALGDQRGDLTFALAKQAPRWNRRYLWNRRNRQDPEFVR